MVPGPGGRGRWWGRFRLLADDDREKEPHYEVAIIGLVVALVGIALVLWITL